MSLDSWRRANNATVYIGALLFLAGVIPSIVFADWRWAGISGAVVFTLGVVIALTEERRTP